MDARVSPAPTDSELDADQTAELPAPTPTPMTLVIPGRRPLRIRGQLVIGSHPDADLRVDHETVSRRHLSIETTDKGIEIRDLDSKNGTYFDDARIERLWLVTPGTLRLGAFSIRVDVAPRHALPRSRERAPVIGSHPSFLAALDTIRRLARFPHPVAIRGETGTGKDVAARLLHSWSARARAPFIAVNCASIPANLAESELFGHEKGAFTGATRRHVGAFERADGGILFLDELGELPLDLQAKLLRVLETGRIRSVGGEQAVAVDVRIVSATHRDLEAMVRKGTLREDLYHRLGVLSVRLPPLRERSSDIPALLEFFARELEAELGVLVRVKPSAVEAATRHPWPGNVRALRNALTRAAALSDGPISRRMLFASETAAEPEIAVPRGTYAEMSHALVQRVVAEEGSLRRAAQRLDVPRSTLHSWLQRPVVD